MPYLSLIIQLHAIHVNSACTSMPVSRIMNTEAKAMKLTQTALQYIV